MDSVDGRALARYRGRRRRRRSLINDLKRHARLAVAWSRRGYPVPRTGGLDRREDEPCGAQREADEGGLQGHAAVGATEMYRSGRRRLLGVEWLCAHCPGAWYDAARVC